MEIFSKKVCN